MPTSRLSALSAMSIPGSSEGQGPLRRAREICSTLLYSGDDALSRYYEWPP